MNTHFITEIEIKNFKCFEDFKAEGFGRVNLIGGRNNVGKTAFMEACYLNCNSKEEWFVSALGKIIIKRDNFFWVNFYKTLKLIFQSFYMPYRNYTKFFDLNVNCIINTNVNHLKFQFMKRLKYFKWIKFQLNDTKYSQWIDFKRIKGKNKKTLFLSPIGISDKELKITCEKVENYERLNKNLNLFDSNVKKFEMKKDSEFFLHTEDNMIPLKEFGFGIQQLINIHLFLESINNGYLFIDEIDNGIHYANFDKLWEIILTISKEQNVQVFATTHSKECIESYARVAKKLQEEEITFIELGNSERFHRFIELGNEVRGW